MYLRLKRQWCPRGGSTNEENCAPENCDDNGRRITTNSRLSRLGHKLGYHGFPAAVHAFLADVDAQIPMVLKLFTMWSEAQAKYHDRGWHLLRWKEIAEMEMLPKYKARKEQLYQKIYERKKKHHQQAPETTSAKRAREEEEKRLQRWSDLIEMVEDFDRKLESKWSAVNVWRTSKEESPSQV